LKGRDGIEAVRKGGTARRWCENATQLTGIQWRYLKVGQKEYEALHPSSFGEIVEAFPRKG
jgi:hypothetical protein